MFCWRIQLPVPMLWIKAVIVCCMVSFPKQSRCMSAMERLGIDVDSSLTSKICANERRDRS